jgi:hypothetical protein
MHPDLVGFVACGGVILSLLSGKLFAYGMEKVISRRALPTKCQEGRCGEFGWIVARRDSESCHAITESSGVCRESLDA